MGVIQDQSVDCTLSGTLLNAYVWETVEGRDHCVELSLRAVKARKENGAWKEYEISNLERGWVVMQ